MKILTVVSTFPPHVYGGGEISAIDLSNWLVEQGHKVGVITTAGGEESELIGTEVNGLRVWRLTQRRLYQYWHHNKAPSWQKPIWHLQDHLDPLNRRLMARVLEDFKPDCIAIHVVSGIGYNALYEIAKRNIPSVYFMHDCNLVCAKGVLSANGKDCVARCFICKLLCYFRVKAVRSIPRLLFCSPSRANLELVAEFLPWLRARSEVVLNANKYLRPTVQHIPAHNVRFLYVGRIHINKGISVLLSALDMLAENYLFSITFVGTGPEEAELRSQYRGCDWCHFIGFVGQQEVSNFMASSDVLCVPSTWAENSPVVITHALSQGLPVIASDIGGITELVHHGKDGWLVAPGDVVAWRDTLEMVLRDPACLAKWRRGAAENACRFNQDQIGHQALSVMYAAMQT
jgi:glycosyltransferase involved in cell wall biosynthesis